MVSYYFTYQEVSNISDDLPILDLKKESPKKSNAIDNQNNDNLSLNQHVSMHKMHYIKIFIQAGVRKDSDSVKLDKTNPTSTNTKAINPSLDDKKKDSNLYKVSQ